MQRIEELAITVDDFRPLTTPGSTPAIVCGVPAELSRVVGAGRAGEPNARWWRLLATNDGRRTDAIEAELDLREGDRVLTLETDIQIELGFLTLDLVEHRDGHSA